MGMILGKRCRTGGSVSTTAGDRREGCQPFSHAPGRGRDRVGGDSGSVHRPSSTVPQVCAQGGDLVVDLFVALHLAFDPVDRVEDGGVVATAEGGADLG